VDLVPTIADVLDLAPQTGARELEGRSMVPLFAGAMSTPDRLLFGESQVPFFAYGWASLRTVRQGAMKYIDAPVGELYDLDRDPGESRNLAGDRAADVRRLAAEVEVWAEIDLDSSVTATVDTATEKALRALGYVAGDTGRPKGEGHGNPMELIAVHEELQVAGHLMDTGRPGEAVRRIREVLGRDSDNIAALRDLSHGLAITGQLDEAAVTAAKAQAVAPWNSRVFYYGADVEYRRGNHAGALALIDQSLALDGGFLEARLERGRYLAELGRVDEATEELGPLLEEYADNPWVALRYAEIIELPAGDYGSAEQRLRTVLSDNPYLADAWLVLGEVLEREDRTADAEAVYREAVALELSSPDLAARLALLLAGSGDAAADGALREAIDSSPAARADLHVALGTRLAAKGRNVEARQQFELAAAAPAFSVDARNTRAMTLLQLGRTAEAEAVWRELIRDHPEYGDPWLNLSSLSIQRGDWGEVERLARAVIVREPESPFAWNNLGISLEEQGRASEAKAAYRRAIEIAPEEWRAAFNLGLLEEKAARYVEAAQLFEEVLAHAPDHVGSHFHLGSLYAGPLRDPARARNHLEATIRLAPGSPRAEQAESVLLRLP
jgi:tetratricopeptide (TPR) repeat protein